MARGVGRRAVDLRRVLAREGAAAVGAAAAVGVDDDLAAREARIAVGAADDELARGVDVQDVVVADEPGQLVAGTLQARLDARQQDRAHVLADALLHLPLGLGLAATLAREDELVVLRRDDDRVHAQRTARRLVVFDGDLRLGVGAQVAHRLALAADHGQLLEDHVREDERRGHHLARLVAGVAEHDALVAGALLLLGLAHDAAVDVGRLLVDGRKDAARVAVELVFAAGVADAPDHAARHALHVDVGLRTHLAPHDHQARGAKRLAGDLRGGIAAEKFVENSVGNLVRDLIGVPLGHRLRCKQKAHVIHFRG